MLGILFSAKVLRKKASRKSERTTYARNEKDLRSADDACLPLSAKFISRPQNSSLSPIPLHCPTCFRRLHEILPQSEDGWVVAV